MSKNSRSIPLTKLRIKRSEYDKILMWSLSTLEIAYICFGASQTITKVVRLCNISRSPKNFVCWNENQSKTLIKQVKKSGFSVVAYGHSHPSKHHDRHPSVFDIKYSKLNSIELIAFPDEGVIRGWVIKNTVQRTRKNEIEISTFN